MHNALLLLLPGYPTLHCYKAATRVVHQDHGVGANNRTMTDNR